MADEDLTVQEMGAWLAKNRNLMVSADPTDRFRYATVLRGYRTMADRPSPPTAGMGPWELFRAGTQKAIADTGRGIGQLVGTTTQQEADAAEKLDRPLMDTWSGLAGNIVGNVATMAGPGAVLGLAGKAAKLPRLIAAGREMIAPTTLPSATAQGAGFGALQPTVTGGSTREGNVIMGGIAGGIAPAIVGAGRIGKAALVDPFTQGGRERLAGQALERFARDPSKILNATAPATTIPGSVPTLAEIVNDTGVSQLQRTLRNDPTAGPIISERLAANNAARINAIQEIAGDDLLRSMHVDARKQVAEPLYEQAMSQMAHDTPWIKGQITQLQKRPAFQKAWNDATGLAAEYGVKLDPENMTQVAHWAKMALDDQIEKVVAAKEGTRYIEALRGTRDKLVSLMESGRFAPGYAEARQTYAAMSRPINQIDVGKKLLETLQPALAKEGDDPRVAAASFAKAVQNGNRTAALALDYPGAKLADVMDPKQLEIIHQVTRELGNTARAERQGMALGSPTAQNLASENLMRQLLGPLGMPETWAAAVPSQTLMRPIGALGKPAEQAIIKLLAEGAIDLPRAQALLRIAQKRSPMSKLIDNSVPFIVPATTAGSFALLPK